jgi:hypothetical protein
LRRGGIDAAAQPFSVFHRQSDMTTKMPRCRSVFPALMVGLLLLSACSSDNGLFLGRYGPQRGTADVELVGSLVVSHDCLMLETSDGEIIMLGWPDGYSVEGGTDDAVISDPDGEQVAAVGEEIRLGGGPISASDLENDDGALPNECETEHAFAVAAVMG